MTDPTEMPRMELRLDPNGVAGAAQRIVTFAVHAVATYLRALTGENLSPPDMNSDFVGYNFAAPEVPAEQRRQEFENWILSKGFQELTRGVREALEEALFYITLLRLPERVTTLGQLETEIAQTRAAARKPLFPDLLNAVNAGLTEPLAFDAEFLSLQKARNCLEHRGGIVTEREVDPATGLMAMSFPRLKWYFLRGEEEVELAPGIVIDTHQIGPPFGTGETVEVYMRRVMRQRDYQLGEPLVISAADFYEIAMACHLFAADLTAKLPTIQQQQPSGSTGVAAAP